MTVTGWKPLSFDEHQVFKTLMADTGSERVVGVVPVSGHMDLKALAAAVGAKKALMADPKVAMRESGYVVGGISPLGQRTHHRTVLDESALQFDEINTLQYPHLNLVTIRLIRG
mgnify:CR=1 FL=1